MTVEFFYASPSSKSTTFQVVGPRCIEFHLLPTWALAETLASHCNLNFNSIPSLLARAARSVIDHKERPKYADLYQIQNVR
jgi:hypothetical protein